MEQRQMRQDDDAVQKQLAATPRRNDRDAGGMPSMVLSLQGQMGNQLTMAWLRRHAGSESPPIVQRDTGTGIKANPVSTDEGGPATVTTLEQDMRDILIEWQTGANEGVGQFVANTLSDRLDQIESGSWDSLVAGLIGNTIWAATTFLPIAYAGKVVFAISMAGISIAAAPSVPHKSKSMIPQVTTLATDYVNAVFAGLNTQLRGKAAALLQAHPEASRYRAIAAMVRNSFKEGMYDIDSSYSTIPQIRQSRVRDALVNFATERLKIVTTVGEATTETHMIERGSWKETTVTELAWIHRGSQYAPRLATLNTHFERTNPDHDVKFQEMKYATRKFESWIGPENKEAAIQQWVDARGQQPA